MDEYSTDDVAKYLRALLLLQLHPLDSEGSPKREVLLAKAGLPYGVIADLLLKNPDAIKKSISRAKKG